MGSFGNYVGATMGTSTNENGQSGAVYDNSFVTNTNYPKRQALVGDGNKFVHVDDFKADKTDGVYTPDSSKLGDVPGLLSDHTTGQQVLEQLTGPKALNWEVKSFAQLKAENEALNPGQLDNQATAWTTHGTELKTASETFKKKARQAVTGKWSGESAEAAEAATRHVTETSIYNFTPASDALRDRLTTLRDAFKAIKGKFPPGNDLIDSGNFNRDGLNKAIHDFNSKYHIDGSGHLRNNSDGYVTAADALKELEQIRNSIRDYQQAVQLFRDTYNPTVQAVAANFPILPAPPDMKFGQPGSGPGTGPGSGPGSGPGTGPGISAFDPASTRTPAITTPDLGKAIDTKLPDTKLPNADITDPTTSTGLNGLSGLTGPLSSAMDAAKGAIGQAADAAKNAGQGLQDPNLGGPQGPPEGVLGLGPQGLGGGGVGKGAGGVGGGGPMPRGLAIGKTMEAPATAAAKAPAAAAGAGLGSGAGSPGAGAPAAGQRGGDQNGKGHQVNKALRRKKNGKDVIGDVEAAVAVVGAAENEGQQEGSPVDQPDRSEQPNGVSPNVGPLPRRIPRVGKPVPVPGQ